MASEQLQAVNFFISLPSAIDIRAGIGFPVVRVDDGSEVLAIRFLDEKGISKRFRMVLLFHQETIWSSDFSDVNASFQALKAYYPEQDNPGEAADRKDANRKIKVTVVQVTCITKRASLNEGAMSDLFDNAINELRRYLKAYHMVTQQPIKLPTRQTTSVFVPYTVEDIDDEGGFVGQRESIHSGIFITHELPNESSVDAAISVQQMKEIAYASSSYLGNVLDPFFNLRREVLLAYASGNTIVAGILLGIAAEVLFDELLLLLLWEEGKSPHEARELFKNNKTDTTFKRIKNKLYQVRIGGNWSMNPNEAIGRWRSSIAKLRNDIAHSGYEPTQKEMQTGVTTLTELVTYIADLLCNSLEKYPICANLIVGASGMERRGCRKAFEEIVKKLPYPTNPQATCGNWKFEVERLDREKPFIGDYKMSVATYLVHASGKQMWLLLDKENRLVKRIPDQTITNSEQRVGLEHVIDIATAQRKEQNTLIELINFKPTYTKEANSKWTPLYMVSGEEKISRWPVCYLPPT